MCRWYDLPKSVEYDPVVTQAYVTLPCRHLRSRQDMGEVRSHEHEGDVYVGA